MSTDDEQPERRRVSIADVTQALGLILITAGAMTVDMAIGLVTAGVAFIWIGWSNS